MDLSIMVRAHGIRLHCLYRQMHTDVYRGASADVYQCRPNANRKRIPTYTDSVLALS
jgi:hypothetical protein